MSKRKWKDIDDNCGSPGRMHLRGNANAAKETRRIELGWMDYENSTKNYKQVRKQNGGGTRHVEVSKTAQIATILKLGQDLFFPDGVSKKGPIKDFNFTVNDFREFSMGDSNVGQLYSETKVKMLRLYLCTTQINLEEDSPSCNNVNDDIPKP